MGLDFRVIAEISATNRSRRPMATGSPLMPRRTAPALVLLGQTRPQTAARHWLQDFWLAACSPFPGSVYEIRICTLTTAIHTRLCLHCRQRAAFKGHLGIAMSDLFKVSARPRDLGPASDFNGAHIPFRHDLNSFIDEPGWSQPQHQPQLQTAVKSRSSSSDR